MDYIFSGGRIPSWTQHEDDRLMSFHLERPQWSYAQLAAVLHMEKEAFVELEVRRRVYRRSAWECAKRLKILYSRIRLESHPGQPPPPPPSSWTLEQLSKLLHLPKLSTNLDSPDQEAVTPLETSICQDCCSMDLGTLHLSYDPYPCPIRRSTLRSLASSAVNCVCCKLMYGSVEGKFDEPPAPGEQVIEMVSQHKWQGHELILQHGKKEISKLRIVHLDDWLPTTEWRQLSICKQPQMDGSPINDILAELHQWDKQCQLYHPACRSPQKQMPDRAIYIGDLDARRLIYLRNTSERSERYVALSYCWGGKDQMRLTSATQSNLEAGFSPDQLAATTRDAIEVAQNLGLFFIWIDALCIRQDSIQDWEEQSAKMAQIYANSWLTIIASRSHSVTEGFLKSRKTPLAYCGHASFERRRKPVYLSTLFPWDRYRLAQGLTSDDPLTARAWAFQEYELASRKVIFGRTQMFWECRQVKRAESYRLVEDSGPGHEPTSHYRWRRIVKEYSRRSLTRRTDRLPALSGCAALHAEETGDKYVAGQWLTWLFESMMWYTDLPRLRPADGPDRASYLAPSWSWVSAESAIKFSGVKDDVADIAIVDDCQVTPKGANPYGEVTDGWLILRAPAIRCISTAQTMRYGKIPRPAFQMVDLPTLVQDFHPLVRDQICSGDTVKNDGKIFLDTNEHDPEAEVWYVILGAKLERWLFGLILTSTLESPGSYQRLGIFEAFPNFLKGRDWELSRFRII